jgi:hypothetical protein
MKRKPVESHIFAGMETSVSEQAEAATVYTGEQLTNKLLEPLGSINKDAAEMELNAPLFYGTIHPTLF